MFTSRYVPRGFVYTPLVYTHSVYCVGVHPFCLLCWCTPILSTVLVYTHSLYCVIPRLVYLAVVFWGCTLVCLPWVSWLQAQSVFSHNKPVGCSSLSINHCLALHYVHCGRRLGHTLITANGDAFWHVWRSFGSQMWNGCWQIAIKYCLEGRKARCILLMHLLYLNIPLIIWAGHAGVLIKMLIFLIVCYKKIL